ncbi:sugar ABC transporter permease [Paenibacillus sp. HB172176]|uniref:ABC transporter permease n=1 Tax=Paenibacillus sp. HB172176 TaxID=2493690 RepID=UPI0023F83FB0|nr:sugar ABC transporter permease [Paenibacillus sp. HB172176]
MPIWRRVVRDRWIYFMLLPGLLYFLMFRYVPMLGLVIAFQDYNPFLGFTGSEWLGFEHFSRLFHEETFWMLFRNTVVLFLLTLIFVFPVPILLSLMLNEVRNGLLKRSLQTVVYVPHFFSWAIIVSITSLLLTTEGGAVNALIEKLGGEPISFMLSQSWFRPVYIVQNIWQSTGWGTIIYLAALSGVDPHLYEAARMDGASRLRQVWHISLPAIRNVVIIMLILKLGDVLELGFDQIYLMVNSMNREVAEVFDTYVYRVGILGGQFSYSTAVGLFKSTVGLILVLIANRGARKFDGGL